MPELEEDLDFELGFEESGFSGTPAPRFLDETGQPLRTDIYEDTRSTAPEKYAYVDYESRDRSMTWFVENPKNPGHSKNPPTARRRLTPEEFGVEPDARGDYRFPFSPLKNPRIEAMFLKGQAEFIYSKHRHLIAIGDTNVG